MTKLSLAVAIFSPIALLAPATHATADPVTFTFNVNIDYRCTLDGCDPFPLSFPVTMTLDDAVTYRVDKPWDHLRRYGVPSFSTIPLPRPDIDPSATRMYTTAVDTTFLHDTGWRRVAHVYSGYEMWDAEGTYYNWNTSIYRTEDDVWPLPDLTPSSMAEFLGSSRGAGFFGFSFNGRLANGELTPDSMGYMGTATLVHEAAPVPEPASLVLFGAGLVGVVRRVVRVRRGAGQGSAP